MSINILLADDHPIIWKGFKEICEKDASLNLVDSVKNGEQLVLSYQKKNTRYINN